MEYPKPSWCLARGHMHQSYPLCGTGKPVPQHIVNNLPEYCKPFSQHEEWINHEHGKMRSWELPPYKTDKQGGGCAKFIPCCHTPRTFIPESGVNEHLTVQQECFQDLPRSCRHASYAKPGLSSGGKKLGRSLAAIPTQS